MHRSFVPWSQPDGSLTTRAPCDRRHSEQDSHGPLTKPARMKPALLASAAVLGLVAVALPSQAAPTPQVVDAKGDSLDTQAAHDVVSVLFTQTKKSGVANGFTVAMTLAGPPSTVPGVNYELSMQTGNCGAFTINYTPSALLLAATTGSRTQVTMECGAPSEVDGSPYTIIDVPPKVKGNVVTWSFTRKMFPKELKKGDTFSDIGVAVQHNEPVFGIVGPGLFVPEVNYDNASGDATFRW